MRRPWPVTVNGAMQVAHMMQQVSETFVIAAWRREGSQKVEWANADVRPSMADSRTPRKEVFSRSFTMTTKAAGTERG